MKKPNLRRTVATLLAVIVSLMGLPITAFAENGVALYAYTGIDEGAQEYATEKVNSFMVAYDSFVDSSNLTLGRGIKIVDPVDAVYHRFINYILLGQRLYL